MNGFDVFVGILEGINELTKTPEDKEKERIR